MRNAGLVGHAIDIMVTHARAITGAAHRVPPRGAHRGHFLYLHVHHGSERASLSTENKFTYKNSYQVEFYDIMKIWPGKVY